MDSEDDSDSTYPPLNPETLCIPGHADNRKLFVGGLPLNTTHHELKLYFSKFGEVDSVAIKHNPQTGQSRGFGFVIFANPYPIEKLMTRRHYIRKKRIDPKPVTKRVRASRILVPLRSEITIADVRKYFSQYGHIASIQVPVNPLTCDRSFCLITFSSDNVATQLLKTPQKYINGVKVQIEHQNVTMRTKLKNLFLGKMPSKVKSKKKRANVISELQDSDVHPEIRNTQSEIRHLTPQSDEIRHPNIYPGTKEDHSYTDTWHSQAYSEARHPYINPDTRPHTYLETRHPHVNPCPEERCSLVNPDQRYSHMYPEESSSHVYTEKRPSHVYPEEKHSHVYPQKRHLNVYPDKKHLPVCSEDRLLCAFPEERDSHVYPKERDSHLYPEERDSHVYTEEKETHMYPEERDPHMYPEERDLHVYPEERDSHMYPEERDSQVYVKERRPRLQTQFRHWKADTVVRYSKKNSETQHVEINSNVRRSKVKPEISRPKMRSNVWNTPGGRNPFTKWGPVRAPSFAYTYSCVKSMSGNDSEFDSLDDEDDNEIFYGVNFPRRVYFRGNDNRDSFNSWGSTRTFHNFPY